MMSAVGFRHHELKHPHAWQGNRETAGYAASGLFVLLAAIRDVYLGGLFQHFSPLSVVIVASSLCTAVFLPIALVQHPQSFRELARRPRHLLAINATSAIAWLAFFYALRAIEPLLAQVLFSGVGPLTITALERLAPSHKSSASLRPVERTLQLGLLGSLVLAAMVTVGGLSGIGSQPLGLATLGVALAVGSGMAVSINTVLCKALNQAGVRPVALVSVRFVGAVLVAGALADFSAGLPAGLASGAPLASLVVASLLLIVFPNYINQIGISLASPITVRIVLALGPVIIFVGQLCEGRLNASPYSLAVGMLYGTIAISATVARRRATRSAAIVARV